MEYNWSNQSCKRIEAKRKQADYQSELARDMHNFNHGGDNGFNAYGENNHGNQNFTLGRHFRVGVEDNEKNLEKELGNYLKDLAINLSLSPSLICSEVSLVELELFLESCLFHVSIYGDLCAIYFCDGLFLVVPCVSKCLSSHTSFEESLLNSGAKFDPSCNDFGLLNNASFVDPNIVGFELEYASFDVIQDKSIGKYVEPYDYVLPFLGVFMMKINGFILFNKHGVFLSEQIPFASGKHELSIVVAIFKALFENTFDFKIDHSHFKDFLLKDFEN
ncbi:hypothetical protein M9H77_08460 [Catharanthus roseus]|uniref:Uncharacterized protein n=1 Tax=Catharanthus roseus TaxID=4058 RepID=A0ACC0BXY0_CATRO|nr:hypothetical protein M9H77_08460 [Catharanthus roseus]